MNHLLHKIKNYKFLTLLLFIIITSYLLLKFALPQFAISKINKIILKETGLTSNIQEAVFEPIGFSVKLKGLSFNNEHLIKSISVDISIMDILKKQIIISDLTINGIKIKVIKDKDRYTIENLIQSKPNSTSEKQDKTDWKLVLKKLEINKSEVNFNNGPIFKIDRLTVSNAFSFNSSQKTLLLAKLNLNGSVVEIDGFVNNYLGSLLSGELNINTKNFDLKNINYFLTKKLGTLEGELDNKTNFTFSKTEQKLTSNLTLRDLKLFSHDLKTIDYFTHELSIINGEIEVNKNEIQVKASQINFINLILSIKNNKFKAKRGLSRSSVIELKDFAFSKPHEMNSTSKPMLLSSKYNDSGRIKIQEHYKKKEKKLKAQFSNIDLLPLSETFEASLGYQVESGKLNLDLNSTTIEHNKKGKAILTLNQFKVDDEDELGKSINGETNLPLKTAISLIKNDKGTIELEFDISGDERNPKLGFLPILRDGVGSFLLSRLSSIIAAKAATQFLPLLASSIPFSPANALLLVNGGYKFLTRPRFQNIEFFSNSTNLKDGSKDVIRKLKEFLLEKKSFNFVLCPLASINESEQESSTRAQSDEETLKLAMSRIEKMKSEFSDSPKVLPQIVFCRPKIIEDRLKSGILEVSF